MVSVKVFWKESGKPAKGKRVAVSFDGLFRGVTGNEITDSNGEAHFMPIREWARSMSAAIPSSPAALKEG